MVVQAVVIVPSTASVDHWKHALSHDPEPAGELGSDLGEKKPHSACGTSADPRERRGLHPEFIDSRAATAPMAS